MDFGLRARFRLRLRAWVRAKLRVRVGAARRVG